MTDTEELIVAALRVQAENRPDGAAVRAALTGGRSRKAGRRAVLIGAAAVLVAAIAITVPLVAHRAPADPPAHLAVPPPAPPVTELDVAPRWLPAHAVEMQRNSTAEAFTRTWIDGEIDSAGTPVISPGVSLSVGPGHLPANGKALTVDGKPAKELTGDQQIRVVWEQAPGRLVTVTASLWPDDAQAVAVAERVAKSVRPAEPVRYAPQLRFDHLPAGWTYAGARTFGSKKVPTNTYLAARTLFQGHEFVLTLGLLRDGTTGLVLAERDGYEVVVEAKNLTGHLPGWPDFSELLEAVQVDKHADVSWVGTR